MSGGDLLPAVGPELKSEFFLFQDMLQNFPDIDFLLCKCYVKVNIIFLIITYILPSISLENFDNFLVAFTGCEILHTQRVLIVGDFDCTNFT